METKNKKRFIDGRILISGKHPDIAGGVAHIRLEDTSRADVESDVIAERIIDNIAHSDSGSEIRFRLDIPEEAVIDPSHFYCVRVWIDVSGGGKPDAGDLFSDRAYRVLTQGYGNSIDVTL